MFEGARHRLDDLGRQVSGRIVGQPVILPVAIGELRLQEEVGSRDDTIAIGGGERLAHAGLVVVSALVGGINRAKARAERELRQRLGALLLPGGAVEKVRRAVHRDFPRRGRVPVGRRRARFVVAEPTAGTGWLRRYPGCPTIRARNSMIRWAAMSDVFSDATSSIGLTSTRSKPTTSAWRAMAKSAWRSSSYSSPFTSADAQPGTSGRSRTSMSMLT